MRKIYTISDAEGHIKHGHRWTDLGVELIREEIIPRKISREQLAEIAGVSRTIIQRTISGKVNMTFNTMSAYSRAFNKPIEHYMAHWLVFEHRRLTERDKAIVEGLEHAVPESEPITWDQYIKTEPIFCELLIQGLLPMFIPADLRSEAGRPYLLRFIDRLNYLAGTCYRIQDFKEVATKYDIIWVLKTGLGDEYNGAPTEFINAWHKESKPAPVGE